MGAFAHLRPEKPLYVPRKQVLYHILFLKLTVLIRSCALAANNSLLDISSLIVSLSAPAEAEGRP